MPTDDVRPDARSKAEALAPLIREHRDRTEADRRIAEPLVAAVAKSGLGRLGLPGPLDEEALNPVTWLGALESLAHAETSVSWIVWNNTLVSMLARFLEPKSRAELFADPTWLYAQSTRPSGKARIEGDTLRVSGRWSLVSGCELSRWLLLTCVIEPQSGETDTPETRFVFVETEHTDVLDTWHVGGLRGTGSHDVVVEDVVVPASHSLSPADGVKLEGPCAQIPIISTVSAGFAAQALGLAQLALETVIDQARTRITLGPVPDLRDRPLEQAAVSLQSAAVAAARSLVVDRVERLWQQAQDGADASPERIADVYAASLHACDVARETVDAMYAAAGTSALYIDSPLERAHRDLHAMLRHVVAQRSWLEDAGRITFGLDPQSPLFLL